MKKSNFIGSLSFKVILGILGSALAAYAANEAITTIAEAVLLQEGTDYDGKK